MSVSRTALVAGTFAAVGVLLQTAFSQSSPGTFNHQLRRHALSRITRLTVEDQDGEKLGRIQDFLIDRRSGEVRFALLSTSGFLGIGRKVKIVPVPLLALTTAKRETMALAITRRKWRTGPTFDEHQIASLNSPARVAQIYDHYGVPRTQTSASRLTPAGREPGNLPVHSQSGPVMQLASDVIGKDVLNRQDEDIGQVDDLLVDWSGQKPTFAVISADRLLKKDLRFAVPLRSLLPGQRDKVVIDANRAMFEQALPLTEKAWNSAGDQTAVVMYRYEDGDPDNTKRNALDRHTQALTPFNQSEAKSDRHTTQTIRRAVSRERGLSVTARNAKIITIDGKVTLRGPVKTRGEKHKIVDLAQQIAGSENVVDQLELEHK